jgi:hypothetical protein
VLGRPGRAGPFDFLFQGGTMDDFTRAVSMISTKESARHNPPLTSPPPAYAASKACLQAAPGGSSIPIVRSIAAPHIA